MDTGYTRYRADGQWRSSHTHGNATRGVRGQSRNDLTDAQCNVAATAEQQIFGAECFACSLRDASLAAQGQGLARGQRKIVIQRDAVEVQDKVRCYLCRRQWRRSGKRQ